MANTKIHSIRDGGEGRAEVGATGNNVPEKEQKPPPPLEDGCGYVKLHRLTAKSYRTFFFVDSLPIHICYKQVIFNFYMVNMSLRGAYVKNWKKESTFG